MAGQQTLTLLMVVRVHRGVPSLFPVHLTAGCDTLNVAAEVRLLHREPRSRMRGSTIVHRLVIKHRLNLPTVSRA